jgi:site-specific DNA-cytosine methylase
MSCDLLDTDTPGPHYMGDIRDVLDKKWDMMIAFPPCTDIAVSGAKHFAAKIADGRQQRALDFVQLLMNASIDKIAIENPIGVISSKIRKPDQIIQPYHFGHEATKSTCLWLKGLPLLAPTNVVGKGNRHVTKSGKSLPEWYNLPPSVDRWKIRSKTFRGIADAMASQWS